MKLKFTLPLVLMSVFTGVNAQQHRTCGTNEHHEFLMKNRPGYKEDFEKYMLQMTEAVQKTQSSKTAAVNITIPVVIHVVYNNSTENISDNQAISQLNVLNADFQKLNADTSLIPNLFKNKAGGTTITFCLAQRDPNGNPTTGIIHKQTNQTSFTTDDKVKYSAQGGDDAWDVSKYMNIWICDLGPSLLGYAEFPTTSLSNTYGLVINYTCTGTMGTAQYPFDKGRTGTHEFGHCFNLFHIWGDDFGACTGSDQCSDTPNQKSENYGTPAFPLGTSAGGGCCNASDTSSMFMNYMDYVDDAAMFMFTQQQCARIMAVVTNPPYNSLQLSDGCTPVGLQADDAGSLAVIQPTGNYCSTSITPIITLKNWGANTLTSASINYKIDNGPIQSFSYSGSLASQAVTNVTLPPITTVAGNHSFTVYTTMPNGSSDMDTSNDTAYSAFTVVGSGLIPPFSEGFEGTFIPSGWTLYNYDNADTWTRTTAAAKTGAASARIDNFTNPFSGELDEMMTPGLDLSSISSPVLTFDVAYKLYTNPASNPNYSDTLEVLVTTDCGLTWTSVYKKFGATLATGTPAYTNTLFVPTSTQWRNEAISLSSFASSNVSIKFRNISDYENALYIDNVNISVTTGMDMLTAEQITAFPNPTTGILTLNFGNAMSGPLNISVINSLGQEVDRAMAIETNSYSFDLSSHSTGLYFIKIQSKGGTVTKRISVAK